MPLEVGELMAGTVDFLYGCLYTDSTIHAKA